MQTSTPPTPVKIAIAGALGRMGRAVAATCEGRDDVTVVARYERPDVEGEGLVSLDEALGLADAVIDFTTPEASVALAEKAAGRGGVALVIGSTGLSQDQTRRIDEAQRLVQADQPLALDVGPFVAGHDHDIVATLAGRRHGAPHPAERAGDGDLHGGRGGGGHALAVSPFINSVINPHTVSPAKAGVHAARTAHERWTPAFAGETGWGAGETGHRLRPCPRKQTSVRSRLSRRVVAVRLRAFLPPTRPA